MADRGGALPGGRTSVIVVGGGQSGLAISHCLTQRGIDHLVLEKHRLGYEWRERRWDTFCLVTPNWQCDLPGFPYRGPAPHGFMGKSDIVAYLEDYARAFSPPLHEGVTVTSVRPGRAGTFEVTIADGGGATSELGADEIVIATGGYHIPTIPRLAERLPDHVVQLHSSAYKTPAALPPGEILVVGTGQSGCQIAEDLHLAGRRVHLCVGGAPRTARRYRGRDVVDWLEAMGYYRMPVHEHPLKERVRAKANHYVTGRDGGRDIDLRLRAREGMRLYGRLTRVQGGVLAFASDLKQNLDHADAVAESIKTSIDKFIADKGIDAPSEPRYVPVWEPSEDVTSLDLGKTPISAVIWSTGFRADHRFLELPVFDGRGEPVHERGVTPVAGLYFLGLPWLHTWGSGRFSGVGLDARHIADHIEQRRGRLGEGAPRNGAPLNELALGS